MVFNFCFKHNNIGTVPDIGRNTVPKAASHIRKCFLTKGSNPWYSKTTVRTKSSGIRVKRVLNDKMFFHIFGG